MEYDRKNKTNYAKSLDIYLTNNKILVKTADVLQIHRKTMASRVEMIEEIMDVDLDNPNTTLHLLLTFQMLKFIDNDYTETVII